jgi:hypothetical protein
MSGFEFTASLFEMSNLDVPNQPVKSAFVEAKLTSACEKLAK